MKNLKWLLPLFFILSVLVVLKGKIKRVHTQNLYITGGLLPNVDNPVLGKYDPNSVSSEILLNENWHHSKFRIIESGGPSIDMKDLMSLSDDKNILLTVEVWGGTLLPRYFGEPIEKILSGTYDEDFISLAKKISNIEKQVYVRFNPEMEVSIRYYPWQISNNTFIRAYRHFAAIVRQHAPEVKLVWGPAGYPGAMEYFPGEQVVDYMSITINGNSELLAPWYPLEDSIPKLVYRKIQRLRYVKKPLFVLGSENFRENSSNKDFVKKGIIAIENNKEVIYDKRHFQAKESELKLTHQKLELGLYDPNLLLVNKNSVTTEHIFIDFKGIESRSLEKNLREIENRGHNAIVTIEPWLGREMENDVNVLNNISSGKYDRLIEKAFQTLKKSKTKIYLRFAHEMEIPINRYTWQSKDPVEYIKAYRYFMNYPKEKFPKNISRVWGPAGDRGSMEWWPGEDVVDYISIAIYGLPDKNIVDPYKQETFTQIYNRKVFRMRFLNKPIYITEFGVKGPEEFQTIWMKDAARCINEQEELVGVNYFNMTDVPKAWGDIKPPDWSISEHTFEAFVDSLDKL